MSLRAVAFDLDGTLYPIRHLLLRAALFGMQNLRRARAFSRVRTEIRKMRPIHDFRRRQAEMLAAETGLPPEEAAEWIERKIYGEWVRSFRAISPYPGLVGFLDELDRRGLGLAVLSDFPVAEKLGYLGLAHRFPVALCSEESGYLKPNPEPFVLLCARLGLAPEQVLFVGDSYPYDILGARAAGLKTAHIVRRNPAGPSADFRFTRYEELSGALEHV